jgi:ATP-dependent helicase YprA (DUF1998 family)
MIPSLVAREVRRGIVEYLTTTFALADDQTREALTSFLEDPSDGIFRGPFLRVRPPFRTVDEAWMSPLEFFPADWAADGIRPHLHQGRAWDRLAGRERQPLPTVLSTGTGSGKTEGFEIPVLDHVIWARGNGVPGIKAVVLYPMNALASDQAARFAKRVASDPALEGVRVGLFVGMDNSAQTSTAMSAESVITDHNTLLDDPPDVLLTNYKMLDRLLTSPARTRIWAANTPDSLRYMVLDEFHTYDGAQGTDVAMLLRRLGHRLGMSVEVDGAVRPLGGCAPVATSATLGSSPSAITDLRGFAGKVFGVEFDETSVIGETRKTVVEALGELDDDADVWAVMPDPALVAKLDADDPDSIAAAAEMFLGEPVPPGPDGDVDRLVLGERLLTHPLLRLLLSVCGTAPVRWSDVTVKAAESDPVWESAWLTDPAVVEQALAWFAALASTAKRARTDRDGNPKRRGDGSVVEAELFQVEVQMWIREVNRLLRAVQPQVEFRWFDSGDDSTLLEFPSVFCRFCGRAGWATASNEHPRYPGCVGDRLSTSTTAGYAASVERSERFRSLISANPSEDECVWLSCESGQMYPEQDTDDPRVPVLAMNDPTGARRQRCPSCGNDDGIRFLGSAVTSLASVTVSQLFGSRQVADGERKLIAFADSVQDANHRAGFFTNRAHRFNLRALVAGRLRKVGEPQPVQDLADAVLAAAPDEWERFKIMPPDLHTAPYATTLLTDTPSPDALGALAGRVRLDIDLEIGLRSRIGRTVELTGASIGYVHVDRGPFRQVVDAVREYHDHYGAELALEGNATNDPGVWRVWLRGLLDRARSQGAIDHEWFQEYWRTGDQWSIWGGRPNGMPAFPPTTSRPRPPSGQQIKLPSGDGIFDQITTGSWWENWAHRTLGIRGSHAVALTRLAWEQFETIGVAIQRPADRENTTYFVLPADRVVVVDVPDDPPPGQEPAVLVCGVCSGHHPAPAHLVEVFEDQPCLRFRCPGRFTAQPVDVENYYRAFYRSGEMRRVVAEPHTSMLDHDDRVQVEEAFKASEPPRPDSPNVLTATPTLEMGIDIGDLSAVMLTSIPRTLASHAQRIGRAGRRTGNSLVTTFAEADPQSLYWLAEPEVMLSGDVTPPDCYLDAKEILARHFLAWVLDRSADGTFDAGTAPRTAKSTFDGWGTGEWLDQIVTWASTTTDPVDTFLGLFPGLPDDTATFLRDYAATGLHARVSRVVSRWRDEYSSHRNRRARIKARVDALAGKDSRTEEEDRDLVRLRGEIRAVDALLKDIRDRRRLDVLEELGLLPNYTLTEDATVLRATFWWIDDDETDPNEKFKTRVEEIERSAEAALREFAPGAVFYSGHHRIVIDSIDTGTRSEPLYERIRTCPECDYATPEIEGQTVASCPRCETGRISDLDNVRTLLRPRRVAANLNEQDARIDDHVDEREQVQFHLLTHVDIDPATITGTWAHDQVPFAFEYSPAATIRRINAGRENRPATPARIAGRDVAAPWFQVCPSCGITAGVQRLNPDGTEKHRPYCPIKQGTQPENKASWPTLGLYHETVTEAVRLLLPVADMESDERLATFKATLMLGLRLSFGGDPSHLRIIDTSHPTSDPDQRQRLLVVHDTVTGGTGYVQRLADPDEMHEILTQARAHISRCPCNQEPKQACHRCLLGSTTRRGDIPFISRTVALDILDQILTGWAGRYIPHPVTGIDVSGVKQSELERRFKRLVLALDDRTFDNGVRCTVTTSPDSHNRTRFTIRFTRPDGTTTRWELTEQEPMPVTPHTIADFVARRVDQTGTPDVAIYLDGFNFHATENNNRLAGDAERRAAIRRTGRLVWNAAWEDITAIEEAWAAEPPEVPRPSRALPSREILNNANQFFPAGDTSVAARAHHNPFLTLLTYLAEPDQGLWAQTARAVAYGWQRAANNGLAAAQYAARVEDPEVAIDTWLAGEEPADTPTAPGVFVIVESAGVLPVGIAATAPPDGIVHVALRLPDNTADLADDQHRARWRAWLHLANLFQFLTANGDNHAITTTKTDHSHPIGTTPDTALTVTPTAAGEDVLDEIISEPVRTLVAAALAQDAPAPEPGYEPDNGNGLIIEAAWPDHKIGILDPDPDSEFPQPDAPTWAANNGWDLRTPDNWSADDLAARTKDNT